MTNLPERDGPLTAVLVGCGGMRHAWLDAVRDLPGLTMTGFVNINPAAAARAPPNTAGATL